MFQSSTSCCLLRDGNSWNIFVDDELTLVSPQSEGGEETWENIQIFDLTRGDVCWAVVRQFPFHPSNPNQILSRVIMRAWEKPICANTTTLDTGSPQCPDSSWSQSLSGANHNRKSSLLFNCSWIPEWSQWLVSLYEWVIVFSCTLINNNVSSVSLHDKESCFWWRSVLVWCWTIWSDIYTPPSTLFMLELVWEFSDL